MRKPLLPYSVTLMRRLLVSFLLTLFAVVAFAQKDNFSVKGVTDQYIGDTVVIVTESNVRHPLKVVAKDNKFSARLHIDKAMYMFVVWPLKNQGFVRQARFVAVPGEKAEVSFEKPGPAGLKFYVTGSKFYKEVDALDRTFETLNDVGQRADYLVSYMKQHPASEAPVGVIHQLDYDGLMRVEQAMSPEVRNGRMKDLLDDYIGGVKKEHDAEMAAAKKQASGKVAPDFTLNDLNGKPLSLSSLKGKYVVLDFWGSWCIWCIKGFPQMKEYYNKYKGKFEVLGIDCSDTQAKWKEAVKKYQLPWKHVFCPRESNLLSQYGIQGFPTKILVGPDGKIVKTIVGEDPAFYTLLDETFGKKK